MKLGMNMIREYADIPVSPKDYESKMIMSGTAVEGVEDVADGMDKVVVGRVLTGMQYVDTIAPGEPPAQPSKIVRAYLGTSASAQ